MTDGIKLAAVKLYEAADLLEEAATALMESDKETSKAEPSAQEMVAALVASTGGKRYGWADRLGVDEATVRYWIDGKRQPGAEKLKLIKEAYKELLNK